MILILIFIILISILNFICFLLSIFLLGHFLAKKINNIFWGDDLCLYF